MTKLVNSRNLIIIMQADLIQPLRDLITNKEIKIRDKIDTVKRWDHEKKKNIKSYEMSKEKYWKACKDTLLCTKNKSDYLKKEEESYEAYEKIIEFTNRFNVLFVEEMKKNLVVFQINEEERFKHLRESLRKLHESEENYLKANLNELDSIQIVINR